MRLRIVGVGLAIVGASLGLAWLLFRNTTTPIDSSDVEGEFAGDVGSAPGEPGVYRLETTGFETVDALQGARHDYPAESYLTINAGECGPIVRWQAVQERWIEWEHCGPELAVTRTIEYHEWFGIPDEEVEECEPPRPVFSAGTVTCDAGATTEAYEVQLLGMETIEVGGVLLDTLHIRRVSELGGSGEGSTVADVWRLQGTPLVVRMILSTTSVIPSAAGDVTYTEDVIAELIDPLPRG